MIYALNARNYVLLDIMRNALHMNNQEIFDFINEEWRSAKEILKEKGIKYDDLRNILTPPHKSNRREYLLCFDTNKIDSSWYGNEVMKKILLGINKKRKHAILIGDFCVPTVYNNVAFQYLIEKLKLIDEYSTNYCGSYFMVYINNMVDDEVKDMIEKLDNKDEFIGYADMTYSSNLKDILAYYLGQCCLQVGTKIIASHEDDRTNEENVNLKMYPYEQYGFSCISVQEHLYTSFLEYKIESRMVDKSDLIYSLNSISELPDDSNEYEIYIDDSKFQYIKQKNVALVEMCGIDKMDKETFILFLKGKIQQGYIYNLEINNYGVAKFNTVIEEKVNGNKDIRILVSFAYDTTKKTLRLLNLL